MGYLRMIGLGVLGTVCCISAATIIMMKRYKPIIMKPEIENRSKSATLIYLPGANVPIEEYIPLIKSIQDKFGEQDVALICHLVKYQTLFGTQIPPFWNPESMIHEIFDSEASLTTPLFVGGHSAGAIMAQMITFTEKPRFEYAGALLHSGFIMPKFRVKLLKKAIQVPSITISGSRDGLNRFTYLAIQYNEFKKLENSQELAPLILVEGMNHMQLANGYENDYTASRDINPSIPTQLAIQKVSSQSVSFMLKCLGMKHDMHAVLKDAKEAEQRYFQPYIDALEADETGRTCINAQKIHLGKEGDSREIVSLPPYLKRTESPQFAFSKPKGNQTHVTVSTYITRAPSVFGRSSTPNSFQTFRCKMVTKEQIFGKTSDTNHCGEINAALFENYMNALQKNIQQEYNKSPKKWNFGPDFEASSGLDWITTDIEFDPEPTTTSVTLPKLHTAPGTGRYAGKLYCDFISQSRLYEHVFIDSHKESQPLDDKRDDESPEALKTDL